MRLDTSPQIRGRNAMKSMQITAERLREVLWYDKDTGVFWTKGAGESGYHRKDGYHVIKIDKVTHLAHRLAWLYVYGELPLGHLDHIDTNKANNRIANLRLANRLQNAANRGKMANNKSGFKGVIAMRGKWEARIKARNDVIILGIFDTPELANAAYHGAAVILFGAFARAA